MPLHHLALAAAVKKYGHLASKAPELAESLKADPKGWTEEEQAEIFEEVTKKTPESTQSPTTSHMKLYDKWRGKWKATKAIRDVKGEQFVTEWTFVRLDEKPNKTGIPMAESQAELFNSTRRMTQGETPCEQLFPAGDTTDIVFRPNNPNVEYKL